jgi:hypothetical protein
MDSKEYSLITKTSGQELKSGYQGTTSLQEQENKDFVLALAKYKLEQRLSEQGEYFDEDNQINSLDFPCFATFRQEEDGLIHRLLVFNHKAKTSLVDLAYYEDDTRPIPERNITLDLITPSVETEERITFSLPLIFSKKDPIKVTYDKKGERIIIEENPSPFSLDKEAIKYAESKLEEKDE